MQIQLTMETIGMKNEKFSENDASLICKNSFSSWILDYYFAKIDSNERNIIGFDDMFNIYKKLPVSSCSIMDLCKNKLQQIENDFMLNNYQKYLNQCKLNDIIDIFLQCQFESMDKTIVISIDSFKNEMDQLFFEYLLNKSSVKCEIDDLKTKLMITKSTKTFNQQINNNNDLKQTLCTYLSLLMNIHDEHVLLHCLRTKFDREMIVDLENLSKNEQVTMYEYLGEFLQRKENTSSEQTLDKYYVNLKEFVDLIDQLQMIIKKSHRSIFSQILRQLLDLIMKYLQKEDDKILTEILEDFSQCFQITSSFLNLTSPNQSAFSIRRCFRRSIIYLCAKQAIGQSKSFIDIPSTKINQQKSRKLQRCFDLPTIDEIDEKTDTNNQVQTIVKRQALRVLDVNSFDSDEREISSENSIQLTLVSDGDKENVPVITKKRRMNSTKIEPSHKKQKKIEN
ncbi:hypothetical protein I4U23_010160 [Adineta vaga]|nr:hypothetical protein I4U23_010160 [Adineta vaga]